MFVLQMQNQTVFTKNSLFLMECQTKTWIGLGLYNVGCLLRLCWAPSGLSVSC